MDSQHKTPNNPPPKTESGGTQKIRATVGGLLEAVFEAEKNLKYGYDALASNEWDRVLEQARGLAVCNPLDELRMLFDRGVASRPLAGVSVSVTLHFTGDELKMLCELLGQGVVKCVCRVDPLRGGVWNPHCPIHTTSPYAEKVAP